ncbi:HupE/UreJ family protein [Hyphomonas sp.]|uniref:HupE/UreJ family protein n=1 Tax=Hyphomonas sp. TaxID=87 RepID=UPI0025BA9E07|nr:HupE/UreJ family protein [Hyphomonas sp.]
MIACLRIVILLLAGCLAAGAARAHEVRPAYLDIAQTSDQVYAVIWKQPILGERILRLEPVFPEDCVRSAEAAENVGGALVRRFTVSCSLENRLIEIAGLERTMTDVFLRLQTTDGKTFSAVLRPGSASVAIASERNPGVLAYLQIGVEHILFGWDHLLFVAGLVLLVQQRQLIATATAFTLAHSVTLSLAALAGVQLPGTPVEIVIALSIALIGLESIRRMRGDEGLSARFPWAIAFGFGLIHGFGFAGALAEIGLPKGTEVLALVLFNLGVELGQIAVIGVLLLTGWLVKQVRPGQLSLLRHAGAYTVGIAGTYWALERAAQALGVHWA